MQITDKMVRAALRRAPKFWRDYHNSEEDMRTALSAALAAMWRPIEEVEPNRTYLLGWRDWRHGRWCMEVAAAITGERYANGYSSVSYHGSATHFAPLPSPPKAGGE